MGASELGILGIITLLFLGASKMRRPEKKEDNTKNKKVEVKMDPKSHFQKQNSDVDNT